MINEKDSLAHYASKYYDPVKAHEYYMRTRELKGRRSSSKLNDEGKEIWSYTKNEITTDKKEDVEEERQNRDQKIEKLRSTASATRKAITDRLNDVKNAISQTSKFEKEVIDSKKNFAIKRIQSEKIPEGLSKEERAKIAAEKKEKIAKLRGDASEEKAIATENAKKLKEKHSKNASDERTKLSAQLKSSVAAAREAYKTAKTSLNESYENIYQTEYDKILSQYAKVKKTKR